ncbi:MAG: cytochrome-c peroxidase [Cryomorphaceae bacterium]|nr:cytochrome-c peroxidase [Cryomorphaceae bacterium]MBL6682571.1 cytochrome-c peroxidase [Cryomorphaceae bacterium]MBL6867739.1 cytochrome-c peroxidase [Cryomorphaceae bacterium]
MLRPSKFLFIGLILGSCVPDESVFEGLNTTYPVLEYPADNPNNAAAASLGERLFFDPILSVDSSISCGSCHKPELGFATNDGVTPGVGGVLGKRNSPSLLNVGFQPYFMREGGVPSLEMQVLVPLGDATEMAHNVVDAVRRLNRNTSYRNEFLTVYGDTASAFLLVRALANFERTLVDFDAPFDHFIQGDATALSNEAIKGGKLFYGKAACVQCHSGVLLTDFGFANNGTAIVDSTDYGRELLTNESGDRYVFKVPSLRKVQITAPYMHDGSVSTLADVVEQYNTGGANHSYTDSRIEPLGLSGSEKAQLVAFLEAL